MFSEREKEAMADREFYQLKHSSTKKIVQLFGEVEGKLKKSIAKFHFPVDGLNITTGKIFRGENYRQFPYVVLDYPKLFSTESVLAFRTMFWWGHEFSFTLHLQGLAWEMYKEILFANFERLRGQSVFICVNDTPWQYTFTNDNYLPVEEASNRKDELFEKNFLKLSRKISVSETDEVVNAATSTFEIFAEAITNKL